MSRSPSGGPGGPSDGSGGPGGPSDGSGSPGGPSGGKNCTGNEPDSKQIFQNVTNQQIDPDESAAVTSLIPETRVQPETESTIVVVDSSTKELETNIVNECETMSKDDDVNKSSTKITLTGQCLTTFPRHLLDYDHVTDLDLPDNLLRRLPSDIRRMTNLVRINLSHNPILGRNPDDYVGLPVELASLAHLTTLALADCRLRYIPPIVWQCTNLTDLDISRNYRLDVLPPDIGQLTRLQQLDARSTGLSTIPDQIIFCRHLERIVLWGNPIGRLPEAIAYLPRLHRFDVDFRKFAEPPIVDDYASGLLRDGAFESGHLPDALFEMPALELLDLDGAKINRLPRNIICPLNELRLGHNYFRSIPPAVYNLALRLVVLDVSGNQLTEIAPEIGQLTRLKTLSADENQIVEISEEIGRLSGTLQELSLAKNCIAKLPRSIGTLRNLITLNLSGNCLSSLPATIAGLERLETLDVSENNLTRLPAELARLESIDGLHGYHGLRRRGLWISGNPHLVDPPPFIWKTLCRKKLYDYLTTGPEIPVHAHGDSFDQRKLIVLGSIACGKSFLVRTMTGTQYTSLKSADDASNNNDDSDSGLVRFAKWTTGKRKQKLLVVDFEGDGDDVMLRRASTVWPLFCADQAIYLIVFSYHQLLALRKEEDESGYWQAIGRWVELVMQRYPLAAVQVVGVQCDPSSTASALLSGTDTVAGAENDGVVEDELKKLIEYRLREQVRQLQNSRKNTVDLDEMSTLMRDLKTRRKGSASSRSSTSSYAEKRRSVVTVHRVIGDGVQMDVVFVRPSLNGTLDVQLVVERVETLAADRKLFPDVVTYRRALSSTNRGDQLMAWTKLKAALRHHMSTKSATFWLNWEEVEAIATKDCGLELGDVVNSLIHLNRTGDAVWYPYPEGRSDPGSAAGSVIGSEGSGIVFPRPRRLVEFLRPIYRRDLPDRLNFSARWRRLYTAVGQFTPTSFGVARNAFLTRGAASERMLACLWMPMANSVDEIYQLVELLQYLKLGVGFVEKSGLLADDRRRQRKQAHNYATGKGGFVTPAIIIKLFEKPSSGTIRKVTTMSENAIPRDVTT